MLEKVVFYTTQSEHSPERGVLESVARVVTQGGHGRILVPSGEMSVFSSDPKQEVS